MYKKVEINNTPSLIRVSDSASIPFDEDNRDFQEYLEWVAEGNEPEVIDG